MPEFISNTIQAHIAKYDPSDKEYKFLLLKRSANVRVYPNIWQVVTGTIDGNETAVETTIREFKEETGLSYLKMFTIPYITSFFLPKKDAIGISPVFGFLVGSDEVILSEEHTDFKWLSLDDCLRKLELPSHIEATKIFNDFILSKQGTEKENMFLLKERYAG